MTRAADPCIVPRRSCPGIPYSPRKLSRFPGAVFILSIFAVIAWSLVATELASAGTPNTVYTLSCDTSVSSGESFLCTSVHTPVSGTFSYNVTFTGNAGSTNSVDHAFVELYCPSASIGTGPTAWIMNSGFTQEREDVGNLASMTPNAGPIYLGSGFTFYGSNLQLGGSDYFSVEGTWSASSASNCILAISGVPVATPYGVSQVNTGVATLHTDNTSGTQSVSCSACATAANQTTGNSSLSQIHTDLTGTLATSCAACATAANQTTGNSTNHSDLSSILSALGGSLTTSCGGCAQNSTLASFQAASHSDASDIYKAIAWALGLLLVLLILPVFMRIFFRAGVR